MTTSNEEHDEPQLGAFNQLWILKALTAYLPPKRLAWGVQAMLEYWDDPGLLDEKHPEDCECGGNAYAPHPDKMVDVLVQFAVQGEFKDPFSPEEEPENPISDDEVDSFLKLLYADSKPEEGKHNLDDIAKEFGINLDGGTADEQEDEG